MYQESCNAHHKLTAESSIVYPWTYDAISQYVLTGETDRDRVGRNIWKSKYLLFCHGHMIIAYLAIIVVGFLFYKFIEITYS